MVVWYSARHHTEKVKHFEFKVTFLRLVLVFKFVPDYEVSVFLVRIEITERHLFNVLNYIVVFRMVKFARLK